MKKSSTLLQNASKNITNKEKTRFVCQTEKYLIVLNDGVQGWDGPSPEKRLILMGPGVGPRATGMHPRDRTRTWAKVYLQDARCIPFPASEV